MVDSFARHPPDGKRASLVPALLRLLNEQVGSRDVWVLRSLNDIVLLARDDSRSAWFVRVRTDVDEVGTTAYYLIEYLMAPADAPWPNATVHGIARTPQAAAEMAVTSIVRSGGWSV